MGRSLSYESPFSIHQSEFTIQNLICISKLIIIGQLRDLCETYHERICGIESDKYDTEKEVEFKDYQITDLNIAVNDLRGKL